MRGPEQKFWASLSRPLKKVPRARFKRIENKVAKHQADVAFAIGPGPDSAFGHCGWIELKACRTFDLHGRADLRHFTGGQRVFLRDWGRMSGACWLFVKVSSFIFAIPHTTGPYISDRPDFDELKAASFFHWGITPAPEDLRFVLQKKILE